MAVLPYLRPPAQCRLVPLCMASQHDRAFAPLAWRVQDRDALVEGGYFTATADVSASSLDQISLVRELKALSRQGGPESVTVYLIAAARTDAAGQVYLLPADAHLDDPSTWLPLRRVLELLKQSDARRRLLILDLQAPHVGLPERQVGSVRPRGPILLDDVAACVPKDLEAVPDNRRLVLSSCAAGQKPLASEALRRSVFGHYLEEGLRGWADASGNGRVTVRELAAFVSSHVERWAWTVGNARQTPVLLGEGSDFTLVDLPNALPRSHLAMPEEAAYPTWLSKAWKQVANATGRWSLLACAERDCGAGVADEEVREEVQTALRMPLPAAPPRARRGRWRLRSAASRRVATWLIRCAGWFSRPRRKRAACRRTRPARCGSN